MIRLGRKRPKDFQQVSRGIRRYIYLLAMGGVFAISAPRPAMAELPVPCTACGATNLGWVSSGSASLSVIEQTMNIDQETDKAILNWERFNIGSGYTVNFNQPSSDSVALNRVWDPQHNPSRILGNLTANGQVYLINRNGIVFGEGAQVDVHSLIASTLDISDEIFENGILTAVETGTGVPAFAGDSLGIVVEGGVSRYVVVDDAGDPVRFAVDENGGFLRDENGALIPDETGEYLDVTIEIEEGAELSTIDGVSGRIMVLAPSIENSGSITTPDGQAVLAAGNEVFLVQSQDPELRGLLVEVNVARDGDGAVVGGAVTNTASGHIVAERGNVSLLGMSVNQQGRITATTSVNVNGSVRLLAQEGARVLEVSGGLTTLAASTTGEVVLGEDSLTEVLAELDSLETAIDEQEQFLSSVEIVGRDITLEQNSQIIAKGGEVVLTAVADLLAEPSSTAPIQPDATVSINVAEGSRIDVSGNDAVVAMERNVVELRLQSNELRNSPLQIDGPLQGETVQIDIREGTPLADASGATAAIQRDVGERTSAGGSVVFDSSGEITIADDVEIDVSGGMVEYQDGFITTTKLITESGQIVDISGAPVDQFYAGVLGQHSQRNDKWGVTEAWVMPAFLNRPEFQQGYTEGADAGGIQLAAHSINLSHEARLRAQTVAGPFQRLLNDQPLGGGLIIGLPDGQIVAGESIGDFRAPDVIIGNDTLLAELDAFDDLDGAVLLSTGLFETDGFSRVDIASNGSIRLSSESLLAMAPGGDVRFTGRHIELNSDIFAPGGSVDLNVVQVNAFLDLDAGAEETLAVNVNTDVNDLSIGDGVTISTAGTWTNDLLALQQEGQRLLDAVNLAGGTITLSRESGLTGGAYTLGDDVTLDVSGGAWLTADAEVGAGQGGSIVIEAGVGDIAFGENLVLQGYGLEQGGALSLALPAIEVFGDSSEQSVAAQQQLLSEGQRWIADEALDGVLQLPALFFQQGGFAEYRIVSSDGVLNIVDDTQLHPVMTNRVLATDYRTQATGASLAQISDLAVLRDDVRNPVSLSFEQDFRAEDVPDDVELRLGFGAEIITDPGASVALTSNNRLVVEGTIEALAGEISLTLDFQDNEQAFNSNRILWLGEDARLLAGGVFQAQPSELGLTTGRVLAAGQVMLDSNTYLATAETSVIDVSGVAAELDFINISGDGNVDLGQQWVAGDAGAIHIAAVDGILLDGELNAHAPDEVDSTHGGLLDVTLGFRVFSDGDQRLQTGYQALEENLIVVSETATAHVPEGFTAGDALDSLDPGTAAYILNGSAFVSVEQIDNGGFDSVRLAAVRPETQLQFDGDIDLQLGYSVDLAASRIGAAEGASVNIDAPYIALGDQPAEAVAGNASFVVHAGSLLELNSAGLQGFDAAELHSDGDIRLVGLAFESSGDLEFQADQIYPATLTEMTISALSYDVGAGDDLERVFGTITLLEGDDAPTPVLSAGGRVTLEAVDIVQDGVLKAPLGEIIFNAEAQLTLAPGSVTSTSSDGMVVPFGRVEIGQEWKYGDLGASGIETLFSEAVQDFPERRIELNGQAVFVADATAQESAAVIDLSGGGDLMGYEYTPGLNNLPPDVLAAEFAQAEGTYAVVPWLATDVAPYDLAMYDGWDIALGQSVVLEDAAAGLPRGEYLLLPARYALLPGAYLVTQVDGFQGIAGNGATLSDGTAVVAGRLALAGTAFSDSRTSGFAIRPGSYAHTQADYELSFANQFLTERAGVLDIATPLRPVDAGTLVVSGNESISLAGELLALPGDGGRGARVDIVAQNLAVVSTLTEGAAQVELLDQNLVDLGVESLLLGGVRHNTDDGVFIDVGADAVVIASGAQLQAPSILLAARDDGGERGDLPAAAVTVETGATVAGIGEAGVSDNVLLLDSDGALLRVSVAEQVDIRRDSDGVAGLLAIEQGATLIADQSIALDASLDSRLEGDIVMQGGSLSLGASLISLGAETISEGLTLSQTQLAALTVDELILDSRSTVDIHGDQVIGEDVNGNIVLDRLVVRGAGLVGHDSVGETRISANTIILENPGQHLAGIDTDALSVPGSGRLLLAAQQIVQTNTTRSDPLPLAVPGTGNVVLGEGDYQLLGYDTVVVFADQQISGEGEGRLAVDGDLQMFALRLTGGVGAETSIDAGDHGLAYAAATLGYEADLLAVDALGAKLSLTGASVSLDGHVDMPGGILDVTANGNDDTGDVIVGPNAVIDLSGRVLQFDDVTLFAPAGRASLYSGSGNIVLAQASIVDVSAAQVLDDSGAALTGGEAGQLSLSAYNGHVELEGRLVASALDDDASGAFLLDVGHLADFSELNTLLNNAGFNRSRNLRIRNGDITIGADDVVRAHQFQLVADGSDENGQGVIDVFGLIDASAGENSLVELYAKQDLVLHEGSSILAASGQSGADGGEVRLGVIDGFIDVRQGSSIDVSGGEGGAGGEVYLRARRSDSDDDGLEDVNIRALAGTVVGAGAVFADAFHVYDDVGTITSATTSIWLADTEAYMANADTIKQLLNPEGQLAIMFRPEIVVRSDAGLTLTDDWDLSEWRFWDGSELEEGEVFDVPGVLTLLAEGDIQLDADLDDVFETKLEGTFPFIVETQALQSGASWSYRIAAGADRFSGDPLALLASAQDDAGSIGVGDDVVIRTGTGDIDMRAASDIVLESLSSAVYTAGALSGYELDREVPNAQFPREVEHLIPVNGGDLRIFAGGDITGPDADQVQLVVDWFKWNDAVEEVFNPIFEKPATAAEDAGWSISYADFEQNFAAFGGGDLSLVAGGDINRISASVPTTIQVDSDTGVENHFGEGDLLIRAGGDIGSGVFFVGDGNGVVRAEGELGAAYSVDIGTLSGPVNPLFGVMEGSWDIATRGDLQLLSVFNPTTIAPDTKLFTYGEQSSASLQSLAGDVTFQKLARTTLEQAFGLNAENADNLPRLLPAELNAQSLQGGIAFTAPGSSQSYLFPSATGNLELIAAVDIDLGDRIELLDTRADVLPTVQNPDTVIDVEDLSFNKASVPTHLGELDVEPIRVVARDGDVYAQTLVFPKQSRIVAGNDIVLGSRYTGEHVRESDVTRFKAGRDLVMTGTSNLTTLQIGGSGRLDVQVGRNLDLRQSAGIETVGDSVNPALSSEGADVTILAGIKHEPDYPAFIETYFVQDGQYQALIEAYLEDIGQTPTLDTFLTLAPLLQRPVILQAYFNELQASGEAAAQSGSFDDYERGFAAVDTLFPGSTAEDYTNFYDGDVSLFFSKIYTLSGGDINLLVPGGLVNAGLAANPPGAPVKAPSDLGIVVQDTGDINAFTHGDFAVNQSRVFTLKGGDIVMWSSSGNIDAGRGAKTSLSVPPLQVVCDNEGVCTTDFSGAVSGSGIRSIDTDPDFGAGDVALFAPVGFVSAGEAGIGGQNVTVSAAEVIGADNFDIGGISVGVPVTASGSLASGLTGVSNVSSTVSKVAEDSIESLGDNGDADQTPLANAALSYLEVVVIGLGIEDESN